MPLLEIQKKICSKCGAEKIIHDFPKIKDKSLSQCKECRKKAQQINYRKMYGYPTRGTIFEAKQIIFGMNYEEKNGSTGRK